MRRLFRMGKYISLKKKNDMMASQGKGQREKVEEQIPTSLYLVEEKLREVFANASDFVLREVLVKNQEVKVIIAYIDGLVNKQVLSQDILTPMIKNEETLLKILPQNNESAITDLKYNILCDCEVEDTKDFKASIQDILSGDALLYIEGQEIALKLCAKGWAQRGVEMPETETVIRGPREGFTETLRINTSLLRRKIKNSNLKFEQLRLGTQTNTDICISYIEGIANQEIINTVRERLKNIKIDAVLESGYIEEFIEDHPYSIFPTIGNSEKPDIVAGKILEGRVAILCDGTPFALTIPHLFIETLHTGEDYYSRPFFSSFIRILRFLALIITTISPALYVSLLSFHLGAIPFELLLSMAASREGVPFSSFSEALFMIIAFEFLREAGVRMPRAVGQAVSIVGALVLGEAAVNAGIASNLLIIVISLTAITSFIVSSKIDAIFFMRIALLVGANILGMMGITIVTFIIVAHMCSLQSFGVSYMAPFAPLCSMDLKDSLVRVPLWKMKTRPKSLMPEKREKEINREEH